VAARRCASGGCPTLASGVPILEKALPKGFGHRLGPGGDRELAEDRRDMLSDRLRRTMERGGDLAIAEAFGEQPENLHLTGL